MDELRANERYKTHPSRSLSTYVVFSCNLNCHSFSIDVAISGQQRCHSESQSKSVHGCRGVDLPRMTFRQGETHVPSRHISHKQMKRTSRGGGLHSPLAPVSLCSIDSRHITLPFIYLDGMAFIPLRLDLPRSLCFDSDVVGNFIWHSSWSRACQHLCANAIDKNEWIHLD